MTRCRGEIKKIRRAGLSGYDKSNYCPQSTQVDLQLHKPAKFFCFKQRVSREVVPLVSLAKIKIYDYNQRDSWII